jgi:hypothetical protein
MNIPFRNLLEKVTELVPKGGAWITLQNINLAFEIFFYVVWESLKLGIFIIGIYYLVFLLPPVETIKAIIYN